MPDDLPIIYRPGTAEGRQSTSLVPPVRDTAPTERRSRAPASMATGARMHSAQHYRQRAAQVRRLRESILDTALLEQLKIIASDYDQIADDMEKSRTGRGGEINNSEIVHLSGDN